MVLRRQDVTTGYRYFVAAGCASINAWKGCYRPRLVCSIEGRIGGLLEQVTNFVQSHANHPRVVGAMTGARLASCGE